jgi:hypothetical protein
MQNYDATLKLLFECPTAIALREVCGAAVARWLNVELAKVQNLRVDMLGETGAGELIQVELQSRNDREMPLRMAEYWVSIYRLHGRFPRQIVIYVGQAELSMPRELRGAGMRFEFELIDIRTLDVEPLLESPEVSDNIIAILGRLRDHKEAVHRIVERIGKLEPAARRDSLERLLILAGLRSLAALVLEEARTMAMHINILENEVLGPPFKKGLEQGIEQGIEQGREEGRQEGRQEGEVAVLRRQLEKRFGEMPRWARDKLASMPTSSLEELSERVLDGGSLEELLDGHDQH